MVFPRKVTINQYFKILYVIFAIQGDFLISLIAKYAYFRLKC